MKRYLTLSRLFCSLILIPVSASLVQARQAPSVDTSPGWAIILTDDYKGEGSALYPVAQYDAVNWYRLLITKMHYAPDHIVLLAEGKSEFTDFLQTKKLPLNVEGQTPFEKSLVWQEYNRASVKKQLAHLKLETSDSDLIDNTEDFRKMFVMDGEIPIVAAPTAKNFRVARNIISHLATEQQMVTIIVATHAGTDPSLIMTKPDTATAAAGTVPSENCLTAGDFALKDCKAGRRMLVMDNSLRDFDEELVPAKSGAGFGAAVESAFSDKNSLILMASDGTNVSWPNAVKVTEGVDKDKHTVPHQHKLLGSLFLNEVAAIIENGDDYKLERGAQEISSFYRSATTRLLLKKVLFARPTADRLSDIVAENSKQTPLTSPLLVTTAKSLRMTAMLVPGAASEIIVNPGEAITPVSLGDVTAVTLDKANPKTQIIKVGSVPVGMYPKDRVKWITARFKRAINSKLTKADMPKIRAGRAPNGDTVVFMPDKAIYSDPAKKTGAYTEDGHSEVKWFVTVNKEFAQLRNKTDLDEMAEEIAKEIRRALDKKNAGDLGLNPSVLALFIDGREAFNKGDFAEAVSKLEKAVEHEPNYFSGYVWLGRSQMRSGQKEEAQETMAMLHAAHKEHAFDPQTEKDLREFEAQMK